MCGCGERWSPSWVHDSAVAMTATAAIGDHAVSVVADLQPPTMTATAAMPAAVVTATGTATIAAPGMTASATLPYTGRPGGSKVTAPVMTASAVAAAPARSASSTVPAAKATATAAMSTPTVAAVQMKSMKAVLASMYTPSNNATATQTTPMVAAKTTYPDSVVSSNAMVINGGGTGTFTVNARLYQTNSASATAHLRKDGVQSRRCVTTSLRGWSVWAGRSRVSTGPCGISVRVRVGPRDGGRRSGGTACGVRGRG